jgi:flagellar biogenesis protein FliO
MSLVEGQGPLGGTTGPDLSRYFAVCAILIVATAGVAWGLRRLVSSNLKTRSGKRSLQIVDVLNLGGKRKLAVVRCYDRTFALGLGEREVTPIAELDSAIGAIPIPTPRDARDPGGFAHTLEQIRASLPQAPVRTRALPAAPQEDLVKSKLVRRRKTQDSPSQGLIAPAGAARAAGNTARSNRTSESQMAARKLEAQDVASAALRIAEKKRSPSGEPALRPGPRKLGMAQPLNRAAAHSQGPETPAAHQIPRMEGILG